MIAPASSGRSDHTQRIVAVLVAVVVASTMLVWIETEDPKLAMGPLLVVLLGWAYARAPLHWIGTALFFLAIATDNPKEHPAMGEWDSPLHGVGVLLYENLNSITGIAALRFAGMDVALVLVLATLAWKSARSEVAPLPRPMRWTVTAVLVGLLALEVWGMARGGDFKSSLWQLRPPIWYAGITCVFAGTIRDSRDFKAIGVAIVTAALVKVAFGFYYYWFICRPLNVRPEYVTTHSDSVLFVSALVIVCVAALEEERPQSTPQIRRTLGLAALLLLGIVINARRLAYIELVGAAVAIYALASNGAVRARAHRIVAIGALPFGAYLAAGWRSNASIFVPAAKIASLFSGDDRSAGTRDIENYNLIVTWKEHPIFGSGMGHPYAEMSRGDSIAEYFALYRFIGHDSVLWLFAVGGLVGFASVWLVLVVGAYFAAIAHRAAEIPSERIAAASALGVIVCFMVQAYGDMGMQSWTAAFLLAMALVVAGKLAVTTGAWTDASMRPRTSSHVLHTAGSVAGGMS